MRRPRGFTLIELMIVIAIIAIIAAIAIPGLLAAQRSANQRNASATLKTIPTVQADFRSNDRDNDHNNNFWTGTIYGLYGLCPSTDGTIAPPAPTAALMIKLIEPSIASADADINAGGGGLVTPTLGSSNARQPKSGYLFASMGTAEDGTPYRDTVLANQAYSGFHNFGKFGIMAAPITRGTGTQLFCVNEDSTVWRLELNVGFVATYTGSWAAVALSGISNMTSTGIQPPYNWGANYPQAIWPPITTAPIAAFGAQKLD